MIRTILSYGVIAGLIVGIPLSALIVLPHGHSLGAWSMAIGYLLMLIALSTVFVAIKRRRDIEGGGVIGFWPAFALGLGISAVAGVVYVISWEAAQALSGMDFATDYGNAIVAQQRAKGVSGADLDKVIAEMAAFKVQYADPLFRWPMTFIEIFPVGVLVSLVSAALLRSPGFLRANSRRASAA